jgi:hypothetical protein
MLHRLGGTIKAKMALHMWEENATYGAKSLCRCDSEPVEGTLNASLTTYDVE